MPGRGRAARGAARDIDLVRGHPWRGLCQEGLAEVAHHARLSDRIRTSAVDGQGGLSLLVPLPFLRVTRPVLDGNGKASGPKAYVSLNPWELPSDRSLGMGARCGGGRGERRTGQGGHLLPGDPSLATLYP